jgi:hypothetical protein
MPYMVYWVLKMNGKDERGNGILYSLHFWEVKWQKSLTYLQ